MSYNGEITDWFSLRADFSVGNLDTGFTDVPEDRSFLESEEMGESEVLEDFYWGELRGTFNILPQKGVRAVAGVQYRTSELDWKKWTNYIQTFSLKEEETFVAPYLQVEYRPIDYALLTGGVRYDKYTYSRGPDKEKTSPKVGLSIFPFAHSDYDWTTIWASYSEGFTVPTATQLYDPWWGGNPDLESENSESWEIGLKQRVGLWANLEFSYFETDYTNEIVFDWATTNKNENIGESKTKGYELLLELYPTHFLTLHFAYTDLDRTDETTGKKVIGRPCQVFNYGLSIEDLYGFYFSVDGGHKGDWMCQQDKKHPADDKKLWDAKILYRWHIKENVLFEPFFSIENITDEEYFDHPFMRIREGRAFHGGLTLKVNF